MPVLYDLFWDSGPPIARAAAVARTKHGASIVVRARKPAVILYPAFFSPAVYFPGDSLLKQHFELLMATPGDALTVDDVNARLVITKGLGWRRCGRMAPLFAATRDRIQVEATTPDGDGILETHTQFRGILHPLWCEHLIGGYWAGSIKYWKVRVHASALEHAPLAALLRGPEVADPMDRAIAELFRQRNGPAFKRPYTFRIVGLDVHPEVQDLARPVLAHHPLAVYDEHKRVLTTVAHVSDLHINMRQDLLAQSNAQVIEDPESTHISPEIGGLVNRYSRGVLGILHAMPPETDALIIGGDLVDHIKNVTPAPTSPPRIPATVASVWECVSLESPSYQEKYQAGPDFITVFTALRRICNQYSIPIFGITGNHDAYVEGYGISPRLVNRRMKRKLANEGIAADHNLTFYEAILAFGPTYDQYRGARGNVGTLATGSSNFDCTWFDWFHTVFTPFSDFVVNLPRQRLVNLGWGESERMLQVVPDGQSFGHLPRASDAIRPAQSALLTHGFGVTRRTLLTAHFTLASFDDEIAESPEAHGQQLPRGKLAFRGIIAYGDYDCGAFENLRQDTYLYIGTRADSISAVLTGHSHRKALYMLSVGSLKEAEVQMVGLAKGELDRSALASSLRDHVPVILSDSAGPLPRSNVNNEFDEWGSDSAAGSVLRFDEQGRLRKVHVLRSEGTLAVKPRAVVSLEYLHYQKQSVWESATLEFQMTARDPGAENPWNPAFWITLKPRWSAIGVTVSSVAFLGRLPRPATQSDSAPCTVDEHEWVRVRASALNTLQSVVGGGQVRQFPLWQVPAAEAMSLRNWLQLGTAADRFLALQFSAEGSSVDGLRDRYDWKSWWTFEVLAEREGWLPRFAERWRVKALSNAWLGDETSSVRRVVEQPDFKFRERTFEKYGVKQYVPNRRVP